MIHDSPDHDSAIDAPAFWAGLEALPPAQQMSVFRSFACEVLRAEADRRLDRQQVGQALAGGWSVPALNQTGNHTMIFNAARDLAYDPDEAHPDSAAWSQLVELLKREVL